MTIVDQDDLFALLRETGSDEVPSTTTDRLLEAALDHDGRASLLTLVKRPGLTNARRLAILDALEETIESDDAPALARAVVRQHPSVVLASVALLERTRSAAALFAVRKPLRRGEPEIDDACDRAAARLTMSVDAERYIRRDGVPAADFSGRELAYAAAAAAPEVLAAIRELGADDRLAEQLGSGIAQLLDDLAEQARSGTLNDFDARLRDELLEAVLLTGVPHDAVHQERALDNLFRRRDLSDVRELAPHLPRDSLTRYASRALNRANRRSDRTDRAALALAMLESATRDARSPLHEVLLECLDEPDSTLVAGAVAALAVDPDRLTPTDRQRVIKRFGGLPAGLQQSLAPRLRGLAVTAEEELDVESFLRWVDGADDTERRERLRALKARWETTVVSCEQATLFVTALARGINRLPEEEQPERSKDLVEAALSWMYRQGTQIVEPSRALLAWPGFARLALSDLEPVVSLLRADQARGLLVEILRQFGDAMEPVRAMAQADVGHDVVQRVLIPVLEDAMRRDLRATDATFQESDSAARRRLLYSALVASSHTKRRIDTLGQSTQDAADAAATQHGRAVLSALHDAEAASEGNDAIEGHFDTVRRAVEAVLASPEPSDVPAGAAQWRIEAAARYPDAISAPDAGRAPLLLRESAAPEAVLRVLSELDQRVHSTRVVAADERTHLRQDLLSCIDYVVDARLVEGRSEAAISSRPALGQLVWSRWAERSADPSGDLVQTLSVDVDARGRQLALLKVDALVGRTSEDALAEVAEALAGDALPSAWSMVTAGLANRLRQAESLEREVKTRGVEVMERVAERLDPPLRAIEGLMVGYFRLRRRLADAGWRPIEEPLGKELRYEELDPNLHEIDGSPDAERFIVRSMGLRVRGRPVRRAVVEPIES